MTRPLAQSDIPQVVMLHKHCFPYDTLTIFGDKFLHILYQGLLELSDTYAFGVSRKNRLVGFIIGVANSKTAIGRVIRRNWPAFALALAPKLIQPFVLRKIWETFFYGKKSGTIEAELLVIGIAKSQRRKGYGKKMISRLISRFRQQNIFQFHVNVYAHNQRANNFYLKQGGIKSDSFRLYQKLWNRYEIPIKFPRELRKVSVILPTYNESENIVLLIRKILEISKTHNLTPEILVVDDNSPDQTAGLVRKVFTNKREVRVIVRTSDRGLARSVLTGIRNATHPVVIVMDTDFSHDPIVIPHLIEKLAACDITIGSRYVSGGGMENRFRHYLSFCFNLYVRVFLHLPTKDSLSGFFAAKKRLLAPHFTKTVFSGFGEYFIRMLYLLNKRGKKFVEVPVFYYLRQHGQRKSQFLRMLITYTAAVTDMKKNLLSFEN